MITIQTKGIYDSHSGAAGWGALIGETLVSGRIHDEVRGSHEAEVFAMTGALVQAIKRGAVQRGHAVKLVTSERHLVAIMLTVLGSAVRHHGDIVPAKNVAGRLADCPALIDMRHLIKHYDLILEMSHGDSHQGVAGHAKDAMRLRRAELT